ncbi:MAG: class I SAM-dependent methyltransferase [Candidatus Omnitrophica bacterium]|nr:class I SAM-dependent methyltransferase [Candidatus Omnitrophota bacterium]
MPFWQVRDEILDFSKMLEKEKPRSILEIGTAGGGSMFLFLQAASDDACLITIDLPGGSFGGGYPRWRVVLYKLFARYKQRIYLIRGDSHSLTTFQRVKRFLAGRMVDVLFIDGDHSYEGVKNDFELYRSLVKKGGIIAFHDIVPGLPALVGGVPQFWNQIKPRFQHTEIIKDVNQGGCGIGIIHI